MGFFSITDLLQWVLIYTSILGLATIGFSFVLYPHFPRLEYVTKIFALRFALVCLVFFFVCCWHVGCQWCVWNCSPTISTNVLYSFVQRCSLLPLKPKLKHLPHVPCVDKTCTMLYTAMSGLQKHCILPISQMRPNEPSYSICRKDFEKLTFNLQIDEWIILD